MVVIPETISTWIFRYSTVLLNLKFNLFSPTFRIDINYVASYNIAVASIAVQQMHLEWTFIALCESVFRERELTFAICYRPSVCRLSVCLPVTFVRPT